MNNFASKIAGAAILIIADAFEDRLLLTEILMRQGYKVYTLPAGDVTSGAVAELSPDLIVLDDEHAAVMKALAGCGTPVLFSGAAGAGLDRGRVFAAGGADYVLKPYEPEEVLARVKMHLALRRLQQQATEQDAQLQQEIERRQCTEASLHDMSEVLEQRIIERTATLRASEAMFRYLLARAKDGYVIVDDEERVVYANAQARVYLGLGRDTDQSNPPVFSELITRQYRCEPQAAWALWPKKMFINREPVPLYLVRPETPTSNAFWLQVEILDIAAGLDAEAGRIICINDITARTAMQDELNRFHAIISHKLRTPLVPLYTGLMFLAGHVKTMSCDDITQFIKNAYLGAEHLYNEVEEIVRYLDAPRVAQSGTGFRIANFKTLVERLAGQLALEKTEVSIVGSLDDVVLLLSQWSLEMVMWEILENAKKFHPDQTPTVVIDVSRVGVQQIRIRIMDDGMTLSPDQLMRMWMPYYQADKYSTGQISGMGLGLSLVATQVWGIGGTCRSYNRDGHPGIVVELVLPCAE